jgi:hypothetical protein
VRVTITMVTLGTTGQAGATREDAVIEAPAATPVREILTRLRGLVGAPADAPASVGGVILDGAFAA